VIVTTLVTKTVTTFVTVTTFGCAGAIKAPAEKRPIAASKHLIFLITKRE
jgi:hypothetical protein